MNGSIIDTNVITKMLVNDQLAIDLLNCVTKAFVPIPVVGELFYGAEKSTRKSENMVLFEQVLTDFEILPLTKKTALSYALVALS